MRDLDAGIPSTAPGGLSTWNLLKRNARSPKMTCAGRTLGIWQHVTKASLPPVWSVNRDPDGPLESPWVRRAGGGAGSTSHLA